MYVQKSRLNLELKHFKLNQLKVREVMLLDINNIKSSSKKKKGFSKLNSEGGVLKVR
jgi:hypothetical protein